MIDKLAFFSRRKVYILLKSTVVSTGHSTGHSFSRWLKHRFKWMERLDFDAKMLCKQGNISSLLTRVVKFNILRSAGGRRPPWWFLTATTQLNAECGPDVCFADDQQSFAGTLT